MHRLEFIRDLLTQVTKRCLHRYLIKFVEFPPDSLLYRLSTAFTLFFSVLIALNHSDGDKRCPPTSPLEWTECCTEFRKMEKCLQVHMLNARLMWWITWFFERTVIIQCIAIVRGQFTLSLLYDSLLWSPLILTSLFTAAIFMLRGSSSAFSFLRVKIGNFCA